MVTRGVVCIIPARLESTRFPGKLLKKIQGMSVLEHTFRATAKSKLLDLDRIHIAYDDESIAATVKMFQIEGKPRVIKTSTECKSGTDRIVEALRHLQGELDPNGIVVNVQGDEPLICADHIDLVIETLFEADPDTPMSTLAIESHSKQELENENVVKVVADRRGHALYFSRAPIPHRNLHTTKQTRFLRHCGIYAFRQSFLMESFQRLPPSALEEMENLEQLRVLEAGFKIKVAIDETGEYVPGVDTPAQLEQVRAIFEKRQGKS